MGYDRHHAIIVTTWSQDRGEAAHDIATDLGMVLTPLVHTPLNGYHTFTVCPDGSKEGWDESIQGDAQRDKLISWLEAEAVREGGSCFDWVEVQYGDDDRQTLVTRSNEEVDRAIYFCELRDIDLSDHPL